MFSCCSEGHVCEGPPDDCQFISTCRLRSQNCSTRKGCKVRETKLQLQTILMLLKEHPRISKGLISRLRLVILLIS